MCRWFGIFLLTIAVVLGIGSWEPTAQAMDPVTIAILAPVALQAAEQARPVIMQGLANGVQGLTKMGLAAFKILYIPLGVVECTVGLPLGGLSPGVANLCEGGMAPFELIFHTIMLPVRCFAPGV